MLFFLKVPNFPGFFCLLFKHVIAVHGFGSFFRSFHNELCIIRIVNQINDQMVSRKSVERKIQATFHIRKSPYGGALHNNFMAAYLKR
jgi:hypothetical protein